MVAGNAMPLILPQFRSDIDARTEGFSIVELMVIMLIAGILLAIGIPSFRGMIQNHRLITATNALFMAVNLTRSEAIHRGVRVDMVPAGDGTKWTNGWVIFVDEDNNQRPDTNETIIYSHGELHRDVRITPSFTDSKVQYIAYNGTGRTRTNANSQTAQSGNWLLEAGAQSRKVVLNFLGRARVCDPNKEASSC
ncbi:type IV fimbrial biogenesis protein FimT [Herminiimonas fonticola]|uniref:Type II secretion system protein H n=2 Tax=Herminiimonas fonticola TaxID=303380 RepID=A0A4R6G5Y4_9BURK|nr:Tfp pilus assembly protein FimT [Herminiimonas fonticola]TDN89939.1 type IV fimbrial biogenesis protein FimT [Herminiimonas fonticola]